MSTRPTCLVASGSAVSGLFRGSQWFVMFFVITFAGLRRPRPMTTAWAPRCRCMCIAKCHSGDTRRPVSLIPPVVPLAVRGGLTSGLRRACCGRVPADQLRGGRHRKSHRPAQRSGRPPAAGAWARIAVFITAYNPLSRRMPEGWNRRMQHRLRQALGVGTVCADAELSGHWSEAHLAGVRRPATGAADSLDFFAKTGS